MYCPKCGKENVDGAVFCGSCGNNIQVEQVTNNPDPSNKKGNTWKIILIIILILIILLLVYFVAFKKDDKSSTNDKQNNNSSEIDKPKEDSGKDDTPKEDLSDVKYTNYRVKINMKASVSNMDTIAVSEGIVDEVNQAEHLKTTLSSGGYTIGMETYTDFKEGYIYTTSDFTDEWQKESNPVSVINLKLLNDLIKSKGKEIDKNKYKLTVTSTDFASIYGSELEEYVISMEIPVVVTTDGLHIIKASYDFSSLIGAFDSFTITMEFSDFDKAGDVIVPDEVKD